MSASRVLTASPGSLPCFPLAQSRPRLQLPAWHAWVPRPLPRVTMSSHVMSGSSSPCPILLMGCIMSPRWFRVWQKLLVTGGDKCQYSPVLMHHHQQQQQCGSRSALAGLSIDLPQCRPVRGRSRAPEAPRTGDGGWSWAGTRAHSHYTMVTV